MLISEKYRFIFIHNYKVAGSSVNKVLRKYTRFPYESSVTQILRMMNLQFHSASLPEHATALEVRNKLGKEKYNDFFKFTFVRNPWDWQVSLYEYMLQSENHYQHELIASMKSFEEYIEWRVTQDKNLQKDFLVDDKGKIIVDFIGTFEKLDRDFQNICETLQLSEKLPHVNKTNRRNYQSYYNDNSKNMIYEHFKEDIEMFHYDFEG